MVTVRPEEPAYAFLSQLEHPQNNCYGQPIETVPAESVLRDKSLNINHEDVMGGNPDRHKQHGFYFSADNCISCHACEAACSEKNDLPANLAFRSVGYIEGGSYPATKRLNISMACNHCDDPVCLKGCPTRAYTKFAEYGAVLQDPDICFGCGYCTWVCPYNAPQLDQEAGHVQKCNMCVDRLEAGLKPACVSACLAGALDFGVIETVPQNRTQLETSLPGFPSADITHPNIRFQQTQSLPSEMIRPDSIPIRYERGEKNAYQSKVRKDMNNSRQESKWSINKLSTHENPLVIFTLVTQLVVGAFLVLFLGPGLGLHTFTVTANPVLWPLLLFGLIVMQTLALLLSTLHLGKPHRFYRAFYNVRYSPVSREVAGIAVFYNFLGAVGLLTGLPMLFSWLPENLTANLITVCGWGATLSGLLALYFMHAIYRIPARPFWNHWSVLTTFYGNMLALGALLIAIAYIVFQLTQNQVWGQTVNMLAWLVAAGLSAEALGLFCHARFLKSHSGEAAASHYIQTTEFEKTYRARNTGLILSIVLMLVLAIAPVQGASGLLMWLVTATIIVFTAVIGRSLFYALVIPTTMPGAFFWKNKSFEGHARETKLANWKQVGVLPDER